MTTTDTSPADGHEPPVSDPNTPRASHDHQIQRFIDDDSGYLNWLAAHPNGYVLNTYRNPTPTYLKLHRATCWTISGTPTGGSNWTKDYAKFCGGRAEMEAFARHEIGGTPQSCRLCN